MIAKLQEDSKRLLAEKDHIIKTMGEENKGVLQVRITDFPTCSISDLHSLVENTLIQKTKGFRFYVV